MWSQGFSAKKLKGLAIPLPAAYQNRIECLSSLDEFFVVFKQKDQLLRDWKTWSMYGN